MKISKTREQRISKYFKIKDTVSLLNAVFGFAAIVLITQNKLSLAGLFLTIAIFLDIADGWVARNIFKPTRFGKSMDIADMISFGVGTSLFMIVWLGDWSTLLGKLAYVVAFLLLICGLLRLARFQTVDEKLVIGLPITAVPIILVPYYLNITPYVTIVLGIIACFWMLSTIEVRR